MKSNLRQLWVVAIATAGINANAQYWFEQGDAAQVPPGQATVGAGPLKFIAGSFTGYEADLYRIKITDPVGFGAGTDESFPSNYIQTDTSLALFGNDGKGIVRSTGGPNGPAGVNNELTYTLPPGNYYLAVSNDAFHATGAGHRIWLTSGQQRPPDGPAVLNPLDGWTGTSSGGRYCIYLSGCEYYTAGVTPPMAPYPNDYFEASDAGRVPATAQATSGLGTMTGIQGSFYFQETRDFPVDMFAIFIADPSSFSASTVGLCAFDTQLFLFKHDATGVVFCDDDAVTHTSGSLVTGQYVPGPGLYYLGITVAGVEPRGDNQGNLIWQEEPREGERPPDGVAAALPIYEWIGTWGGGLDYRIALTGAYFATSERAEYPVMNPRVITGDPNLASIFRLTYDDQAAADFKILPSVITNSVEFDFSGNLLIKRPNTLYLQIKSAAGTRTQWAPGHGLKQMVQMYDYYALQWRTIGPLRSLPTAGTSTLNLKIPFSFRFISPLGEVKGKIICSPPPQDGYNDNRYFWIENIRWICVR